MAKLLGLYTDSFLKSEVSDAVLCVYGKRLKGMTWLEFLYYKCPNKLRDSGICLSENFLDQKMPYQLGCEYAEISWIEYLVARNMLDYIIELGLYKPGCFNGFLPEVLAFGEGEFQNLKWSEFLMMYRLGEFDDNTIDIAKKLNLEPEFIRLRVEHWKKKEETWKQKEENVEGNSNPRIIDQSWILSYKDYMRFYKKDRARRIRLFSTYDLANKIPSTITDNVDAKYKGMTLDDYVKEDK